MTAEAAGAASLQAAALLQHFVKRVKSDELDEAADRAQTEREELTRCNGRLWRRLEGASKREADLKHRITQLTAAAGASHQWQANAQHCMDDHRRTVLRVLEQGRQKDMELEQVQRQMLSISEANRSLSSQLAALMSSYEQLNSEHSRQEHDHKKAIEVVQQREAQQEAAALNTARQLAALQAHDASLHSQVTLITAQLKQAEQDKAELLLTKRPLPSELANKPPTAMQCPVDGTKSHPSSDVTTSDPQSKPAEQAATAAVKEVQEWELMAQSMYTEAAAGGVPTVNTTCPQSKEDRQSLVRQLAEKGQLVRRLVALLNHGHRIVVNKHSKEKEMQRHVALTDAELERSRQHQRLDQSIIDALNQQLQEMRDSNALLVRESRSSSEAQKRTALQLQAAKQREDELARSMKHNKQQLVAILNRRQYIHKEQTAALQARVEALEQQLAQQPQIRHDAQPPVLRGPGVQEKEAKEAKERLCERGPTLSLSSVAAAAELGTRGSAGQLPVEVRRSQSEPSTVPVHQQQGRSELQQVRLEWTELEVTERWSGHKRSRPERLSADEVVEEEAAKRTQPFRPRPTRYRCPSV